MIDLCNDDIPYKQYADIAICASEPFSAVQYSCFWCNANSCNMTSPLPYRIYYRYVKNIFAWFINPAQKMGVFSSEDKDLFILHIQYQSRCWPGDTRSQGMNSHEWDWPS